MDTEGERGNGARPIVPAGRHIWLRDRGRTFVRQAAGPVGAPTVVLLHGWTATADLNWWASYAALAEHVNVVALDHRGHGRGLRGDTPFRLEQCADDVAAVADALGLTRIIPVGYSMGGPIAQLVWRRHRHLVAGLVLCATSASFRGTARERMLHAAATGSSALVGTASIGRMTNAALGKLTSWRGRRDGAWWGYDEVRGHDWPQILEAGRATLRFDSRRWIGAVDVPTAVLVSDHDLVVPTHRQEDLAGRIGHALRWKVRGGHDVCTTAPERFVPALVDACRAVASRAALSPASVAA
ncbi:MAG: alpha/beta fold hydrolase [Desertimonas sp.]